MPKQIREAIAEAQEYSMMEQEHYECAHSGREYHGDAIGIEAVYSDRYVEDYGWITDAYTSRCYSI